MTRTECGACGGTLHMFLDLGMSPIADAYTTTPDEEVEFLPLQLAVCHECHLVQLLEVVDSKTLFGTGYSFYSSASPPLSTYHATYANDVIGGYCADGNTRTVVEVGCNDGDMLRWFKSAGMRCVGVDPASGPVEAARHRGLEVWGEEFSTYVSEQLRDAYGPADIVIANHVLAHVGNVGDVLAGIASLLSRRGVAFIEVQYLPDLLVNNSFDLVYHEHRNFFSLSSLMATAALQGLRVFDAQLTSRQGGSLRVTLQHHDGPRMIYPRVRRLRRSERWITSSLSAYESMQGRVERVKERLWDLLDDAPTPIAGYGAPAKATTLLHSCGIDRNAIDHIVDTTEAKQGRFIPGLGIPIVAPGARPAPSTYLLLAWNYMRDIIRNGPAEDTAWIMPFPAPTLL